MHAALLQMARRRREYHLSAKAPPAVTQDSLQEIGVVSERMGTTDRFSQAEFSGREEFQPEKNGSLQRKDFGKFVQFFRMSSSYIAGHRSNLFVVCLPGEVRKDQFFYIFRQSSALTCLLFCLNPKLYRLQVYCPYLSMWIFSCMYQQFS